ncbi:MAG: glycine zipper 2TM domain-containing protein [Vicinamibacterales bacterium]
MNNVRHAVVALLVASAVSLPPIPAFADQRDRGRHDDRYERDHRHGKAKAAPKAWRQYDYRHYEPGQRGYDPVRYYRSGGRYRPVRLGRYDRIYRGSDNRYYCRRDDGTTGLIVGGIAGGILGSIIAPGDSKAIGAIIGAGAGAIIGREIDDGIECR